MSDIERPSDSAHPDEALAGLVDGTLSATERADLQTHLDGCERCRSEVALAESAARALRGLPELDAPWGLGHRAIEEARKGVRAPRFRRVGTAAGIAAAAILVAGLSFAVLRGPQGNAPAALAPSGRQATPTTSEGVFGVSGARSDGIVVKSTLDYSADDLRRLATHYSLRKSLPNPNVAPEPSTAPAFSPVTSGPEGGASFPPTPSGRPQTDLAALDPVACVDTAAGYDASIRPVRVIDARFEEKPALIGIFLNGPEAGQPPDLVVIWVASKQCDLLSYASHRIKP